MRNSSAPAGAAAVRPNARALPKRSFCSLLVIVVLPCCLDLPDASQEVFDASFFVASPLPLELNRCRGGAAILLMRPGRERIVCTQTPPNTYCHPGTSVERYSR